MTIPDSQRTSWPLCIFYLGVPILFSHNLYRRIECTAGGEDVANTKQIIDALDAGAADPLLETMGAFTNDFPLDPDLWLSLDAFPFSDFGQLE